MIPIINLPAQAIRECSEVTTTVHNKVAMLQLPCMVLMNALKFGHFAALEVIHLHQLGMVEHLFVHIMLLVRHLLNG